MTKKKVYDGNVPLFLIAIAIAKGVKKRGAKLFRISVVRTEEHQYQIKYKCRARDVIYSRAPDNLSPCTQNHPSPEEEEDDD